MLTKCIHLLNAWPIVHTPSPSLTRSGSSQNVHGILSKTPLNCSLSALGRTTRAVFAVNPAPATSSPWPYIHSQALPSMLTDVGMTRLGVSCAPSSATYELNKSLDRPRLSPCNVLCPETNATVVPPPGELAMPQNRYVVGYTCGSRSSTPIFSSSEPSPSSSESESDSRSRRAIERVTCRVALWATSSAHWGAGSSPSGAVD